jgi:hypothetical protein
MIQRNLRVPGGVPLEAPFAIFDDDPVPGFKASVKKAGRLVNEALGGEQRRTVMAAAWAAVFRKITADRLEQLPSGGSLFCPSNQSDGKKMDRDQGRADQGKAGLLVHPGGGEDRQTDHSDTD